MSKRRKRGDIIYKKMGAGFVGVGFRGRIAAGSPAPCMLCDDPECREWPNIEALNMSNGVIGMAYHVSECEMEDDENVFSRKRGT